MCGAKIDDAARFCPNCGAPVANPKTSVPPQSPANAGPSVPPQSSANMGPSANSGPSASSQPFPNMGPSASEQPFVQSNGFTPPPAAANTNVTGKPAAHMKWYRFILIFAAMWLTFGCVVDGVAMTFIGSLTISGTDYLYRYIPALRPLEMIFGVITLFVAVAGLLATICVNKYSKNSRFICNLAFGGRIAAFLIYIFITSLMLRVPMGDMLTPISVLTVLVFAVILVVNNCVYFKKNALLYRF